MSYSSVLYLEASKLPPTIMRLVLIIGDIFILLFSVPVTLALRSFSLPSIEESVVHLIPFSFLALVAVAIFFSAGLYDMRTALMRRELPGAILGAQVVNALIAALFFFFVPIFGIAPKTNLFIYFVVSALSITAWRILVLSLPRVRRGRVVVIGDSAEHGEVSLECGREGLYPFDTVVSVPILDHDAERIEDDVSRAIENSPTVIVADTSDERIKSVLPLIFLAESQGGSFIDFTSFYERLFKRIPLSTLDYRWFLPESTHERVLYRLIKRAFDIVFSTLLLCLLLILLPFVALAIRVEGKGPIFVFQKRLGRDGKHITVLKFRTMTASTDAGVWVGETENRVTRVGGFLRKTSIDELPQVLSVFTGDLSLIGPRSDILGLAERLAEAIPFYNVRYTVTPGISGWAQVNQRYSPGKISPQSIEESRVRLTYDLYYVKHGSPLLDLSIMFRTLKTLLSRLVP